MSELTLNPYWERVESRFRGISAALAQGDSAALTEHASALQQLAVDLQHFLNSGGAIAPIDKDLRKRMREFEALMPALRDALYRRSAYIDQALQTLVPVMAESTYAAAGGAKVYGAVAKSSGSLKTVAA